MHHGVFVAKQCSAEIRYQHLADPSGRASIAILKKVHRREEKKNSKKTETEGNWMRVHETAERFGKRHEKAERFRNG